MLVDLYSPCVDAFCLQAATLDDLLERYGEPQAVSSAGFSANQLRYRWPSGVTAIVPDHNYDRNPDDRTLEGIGFVSGGDVQFSVGAWRSTDPLDLLAGSLPGEVFSHNGATESGSINGLVMWWVEDPSRWVAAVRPAPKEGGIELRFTPIRFSQLSDQSWQTLADANAVWFGKGSASIPLLSFERLEEAYGRERAAELEPVLRELHDQFYRTRALDLDVSGFEGAEIAAEDFVQTFPRAPAAYVDLLKWDYSFNMK